VLADMEIVEVTCSTCYTLERERWKEQRKEEIEGGIYR